jgi:hypothetical protein
VIAQGGVRLNGEVVTALDLPRGTTGTLALGSRRSLELPDDDAIHGWFNLTYANYLVIPRSILQSMPGDWQTSFVALLRQYEEAVTASDLFIPPYEVRALERRRQLLDPPTCPECEGEGEDADGKRCEACKGEGVDADIDPRYETAEEVGITEDPLADYERGRRRVDLVPV